MARMHCLIMSLLSLTKSSASCLFSLSSARPMPPPPLSSSSSSRCISPRDLSSSSLNTNKRPRYARRILVALAALVVLATLSDQGVDAKVYATQMSQGIVTTQYGRLRGILVTEPEKDMPQVEAYLGLEYASLLGGELRFMPPTSPVGKWNGVKPALKFKPVCPQRLPDLTKTAKVSPRFVHDHYKRLMPFLEAQQEDCLNLNVYRPATAVNSSSLLPVVMFVHGEDYDVGTGNAYDGSVMAAYGDLVWITLNYRLGVLGFMSTGDSQAPGNYALLDLMAALHWVTNNIEAFKGDPKKVTLLGHGYGAAMVHMLAVSPMTKGKHLFQQVVLLSGTGFSSWSTQTNPLHLTLQLASKLNCTYDDDVESGGGSGSDGKVKILTQVKEPGKFSKSSTDTKTTTTKSLQPSPPPQSSSSSSSSSSSGDLKYLRMVQCLKKKSVEELTSADLTRQKYFPGFGPIVDGQSILPTSVRNLTEHSCDQLFGKQPLSRSMASRPFVVKSSRGDTGGSRYRLSDADTDTKPFQYFSSGKLFSGNESNHPELESVVRSGMDGRGEFCKVPMLIGTVATSSANLLLASDFNDEMTSLRSAQVLRTYVRNNYRFHRQKIYDILAHNYYDWDRPNDRRATERSLVELLSDGQFDAPSIKLAKIHSSCLGGAPTFFFHFGSTGQDQKDKSLEVNNKPGQEVTRNRQKSNFEPRKMSDPEATNPAPTSVQFANQPVAQNHTGFFPEGLGAELPYFFGASLVNGVDPFKFDYSQSEQQLTEHLVGYLVNFFKTGDPNGPPAVLKSKQGTKNENRRLVLWPTFDHIRHQYLQIGEFGITSRAHYKSHKMALWLELIPKIHKPDTFDPNLHLLDDPKNDSTFEPVGTRSLDSPLSPWAPDWRDDFSEAEDLEGALPEEVEDEKLDLNRGLQNYPDKDLGRDPTSKTQGGKIPGDLSNRPKKLPTSNGDLDGEPEASSSQMSVKSKVSTQDKYNELLDQGGEAATGGSHDSVSGHRQVNNPNPKTNQQSEPDKRSSTDFDKQSGQSSTLTLTVSVGCALLLLNCVVFAATFCQWHRFGRTPRNREPEAEMLKDKMAIATTSGCIQETEFYGRGVHPSFFHSKDLNQHPYRQCTSSSPSAAMAAVSIATTTTTIDADSPYKYNHLLPTQPTHMKPPPRSTPVQSAVAMTSSSHVTENHVTGTDHDHAKFDQSQQTSSHSTTIV